MAESGYLMCTNCTDLIANPDGSGLCVRCRPASLDNLLHHSSHEARGEAAARILGKPDNWVHRSKGMRCSTCMWFVEKVPEQGEAKVGRCRKHAPTLNGWPAMKLGDWCGDHKLDEEKLDAD